MDIKSNKLVTRLEDMSPTGRLNLMMQPDGDILIQILEDDGYGEIGNIAAIEFCAIGTGGGQSPRTLKALVNLMIAMKEDNNDSRLDGRKFKEGKQG